MCLMFCIFDIEKNCKPIKSGFKKSSQANNWAKKNLPRDEVQLWGEFNFKKKTRYLVRMK